MCRVCGAGVLCEVQRSALKRAEGRGGGLCHAGRDMRAERQNSGDTGDTGREQRRDRQRA